jgi:hypothetical protein
MSRNALATANGHEGIDIAVVEKVITGGDLGQLTPEQRVRYYIETCESLKLNWKTKPFDVVALRGSGPKILYPNKGCAEQLAGIHNVSVDLLEAHTEQGVRIQKAKACLANGRCVTKTGAVTVDGLRGDSYANAVMKCETKAHRRAVLALVGLNMPDESELETIPGSQRFTMDVQSGDIAPRPARAVQAEQSTHSAIPVAAGAVDAETGEIQPTNGISVNTSEALFARIKSMRELLGWTADDVRGEAKRQEIDLRTLDGLQDMIDVLAGYAYELEYGDASSAQGTLLDADVAPIDRWAD